MSISSDRAGYGSVRSGTPEHVQAIDRTASEGIGRLTIREPLGLDDQARKPLITTAGSLPTCGRAAIAISLVAVSVASSNAAANSSSLIISSARICGKNRA